MKFFATTPPGLSELLREELISLGAQAVKAQPRGVAFEGSLETGYRACLWSRFANQIYLELLDVKLDNQEALYRTLRDFAWNRQMNQHQTFLVSFTGKGLGIDHTHFGALTIKDAIVDFFRDTTGVRPNIDKDFPDLQFHGHLNRNQFTLSLNLSGHSLHQRGYREGVRAKAPLKENVAAAILHRAGWAETAKSAASPILHDPMCGSGTFLIEAAMIATDTAPGLVRALEMGFNAWIGHDEILWQKLRIEAEDRAEKGWQQALQNNLQIYGSDAHPGAIAAAKQAVKAAGFAEFITLKQAELAEDWLPAEAKTADKSQPDLVVCNPPYGERLGEDDEVKALYVQIGEVLKQRFVGWQAAILTCNKELGLYLGLKAKRDHDFMNGALECKLFRFEVEEEFFRQPALKAGLDLAMEVELSMADLAKTEGAQMFANRLRKNLKSLRKWANKNEIYAYRIYDADMPEYALSVDLYQTIEAGDWLVVNEYAPPKSVNAAAAKRRLYEAMAVLPDVLDIDAERIIFKVRQKQKGHGQYEKLDERKEFFTLIESDTKLRVNFTDYLDTGLFLDHREVRKKVAELAKGKRLLNLFCYTASASAIAAVQGAKSSLSLDMSKTYLYWAKHNFLANKIDERQHQLQQEDVVAWLKNPPEVEKFDVIFLDPPSFSSSKKMDGVLDVQRDYLDLIYQAGKLLKPDGTLVFSNNLRKFKLDETALKSWQIQDITKQTLPEDFKRNPNIHQAWLLTRS